MVQERSPNLPTREGLRNEPLAWNPDEWLSQQLLLNDQLPAAERACAPSEMELRNLADLYGEYDREYERVERQNEDPYVRDTLAPRVFEDISEFISAYYSFDEKQNDFLKNIISFGLSHGLTENDLFAISTELDWLIGAGEFLYGMETVVSLCVAKILYENRYLYGIYEDVSPGFDLFADSIEYLIADGRVSVRVMTVGDSMDEPTSGAFYDSEYNELVFPAHPENISIAGAMGVIIHECRHALQDYLQVSCADYQKEFDAEFNGEWVTQVLGKADRVSDWTGTERLDELDEEIAAIKEAMEREGLRCIGCDEEMINFFEALDLEIGERYDDWINAVFDELEGYDSGSAAAYYSYYMLLNFDGTLRDESSYWALELDGLSEEELAGEYEFARQDLIAQHIMTRTISLLFPRSSYRGEATYNYVSQFQKLRAIAYMIDKDMWSGLTYALYGQTDEIAEGLMYLTHTFDGI